MNKTKPTINKPIARSKRQSNLISKDDAMKPGNAIQATNPSSGTLNIRQMAEDAAKVQEYIANGGKQEKSSAVKVIKSSGLFNNRVG